MILLPGRLPYVWGVRLLVVIAVFGFGWYTGNQMYRPSPGSVTPTEHSIDSSTTTETIRTVIRAPDGTTTEKVEERQVASVREREVTKPAPLPKWSVTAAARFHYDNLLSKPQWDFLVHRRIGETGVWAGGGYSQLNSALLLSLRYDF